MSENSETKWTPTCPTIYELKEFPQLRVLARMAADQPCFTNAILAVTEAYQEGWYAALKSARGER